MSFTVENAKSLNYYSEDDHKLIDLDVASGLAEVILILILGQILLPYHWETAIHENLRAVHK